MDAKEELIVLRLLLVYLDLSKARLSALVVATAAVSYIVARGEEPIGLLGLSWTAIGTAFAAAGANALNQVLEADRDGLMARTSGRPLPARTIGRLHGVLFGLAAAIGGPVLLALRVNLLAAVFALAAVALYVLAYTPLKTRSPACTLVGAVSGALPPVIGWSAATGRIDAGGLLLGGILFAWQVPHFLSLAWMHREEYARAGFRMLPVLDRTGRVVFRMIVLYSLLLIPAALALVLVGAAGPVYAAGSLVLGLGFLLFGIRFIERRTAGEAKRLFLASVVYLPLLLGLLALDRGPAGNLSRPARAETMPLEDSLDSEEPGSFSSADR